MATTSTTTSNSIGAVVFFSYIVAGLVVTGVITRDLFLLYSSSHDIRQSKGRSITQSARRRDRGQIFVALSVLSFALLSYHMLNFLIQSYSTWGERSGIALPVMILGDRGIFDINGKATSLHLWRWSIQSTLFQTFAESIVDDPLKFWWTQQALLYSLGWNVFMAVEGTRYQIPHLWAYFVLDQILPISFTQTLFCAATCFSPNLPLAAGLKASAKVDQFVVVAIYLLGLSMISTSIGKPTFFVLLFGIRALLFAPFWMLRPTVRVSQSDAQGPGEGLYWGYRYSASVLAVGGLFLHFQQTQRISSVVEAVKSINENPAVSALGYDYLVAATSLVIFIVLSKF